MKHLFFVDEGGTTAIEYALLGSLISVVIVVALTTLGTKLGFLYDLTAALMEAAY